MSEQVVSEQRFSLSNTGLIIFLSMAIIGVLSVVSGFLSDTERTWSNLLIDNFYFLSLAIGATFFQAIQYVTQSGWSAGFKRIPEAVSQYVPVAALFFLIMLLGLKTLYPWAVHDNIQHDAILTHRAPYLNVPFFVIRNILFFALWIWMIIRLRRMSLREDIEGGLKWFQKSEFNSKVLIFILAITFSFSIFDWMMSVDPHWYSSIFAMKDFIASFYHGSVLVILLVLFLHDKGYFTFLNKSHLHDFARYIFILAIIWGYLWFSQFLIIWYGNIPEESIYLFIRTNDPWKIMFFGSVVLNWAVPFLILMPRSTSRSKVALRWVSFFVLAGLWVDYFQQVFPVTLGEYHFGWMEIGIFIGFAGIFLFVVLRALGKASIIPVKHPYLEESLEHHF